MKCLSAKEYTKLYKIVIKLGHKTPMKYPTIHIFRINCESAHGIRFGLLNINDKYGGTFLNIFAVKVMF
jgi:hypothetical protein